MEDHNYREINQEKQQKKKETKNEAKKKVAINKIQFCYCTAPKLYFNNMIFTIIFIFFYYSIISDIKRSQITLDL